MTRAGSGDDPAALHAAARELADIARKAKAAAAALAAYGEKLGPISNGVTHLVGGSTSRVDKHMVTTLGTAMKGIGSAQHALEAAANQATKLAAAAAEQARAAARQQAAQSHSRR